MFTFSHSWVVLLSLESSAVDRKMGSFRSRSSSQLRQHSYDANEVSQAWVFSYGLVAEVAIHNFIKF